MKIRYIAKNSIFYQGNIVLQCGADHIKQAQLYPDGLPRDSNVRCVSYDGDADRIMYYYLDDSKKFHIVDGDKMAVLCKYSIKMNLSLNLFEHKFRT